MKSGRVVDGAYADRLALAAVARQEIRAAPALGHGGEFPAKIDHVADAGVHAHGAGRRKLMHRVAREEHPSLGIPLGDKTAPRPDAQADPFDVERLADRTPDQRILVNARFGLLAVGVNHHQPPHGVDGIDHADVGPQPVAVDGEKEGALRLAAALQQIRRAEEQVHRITEDALAHEADAELAADRAGGAIAADQVVGLDPLAFAAVQIEQLRGYA
jgi:hypothetical protein